MKANCKINLKLNVKSKMSNGYHSLDMIMQEIDLHDDVYVVKNNQYFDDNWFLQNTNNSSILALKELTDENNLIIKAYNYMKKQYSFNDKLTFYARKNTPISAGLGGGSSDCASTIKQINKILNLELSTTEMINIACHLGADVPFFILGGQKHCLGIGEILEESNIPISSHILIVTANVYVSTKDVFFAFDNNSNEKYSPKYNSVFENDLASYAIKQYPIIENIILQLNNFASNCVQMSGSGPSIFAMFNNKVEAENALNMIKKLFPNDLRYLGIHKPIF